MRKVRKHEHHLKELSRRLAATDDPAMIFDFLYGALTPHEREAIALRWQLVKLLEGGATHRATASALGVSLCKITRGSWELKHGRKGFREFVKRAVSGTRKQGTARRKG